MIGPRVEKYLANIEAAVEERLFRNSKWSTNEPGTDAEKTIPPLFKNPQQIHEARLRRYLGAGFIASQAYAVSAAFFVETLKYPRAETAVWGALAVGFFSAMAVAVRKYQRVASGAA